MLYEDVMQEMKLCSKCRESIDKNASICPHCRSNTEYTYFIEVSEDKVQKVRYPLKRFLSEIICLSIIGVAGFYGIIFFGIWIGLGIAIIAWKIVYAVADDLGLFGYNLLKEPCPNCLLFDDSKYKPDAFCQGNQSIVKCRHCKQSTMVSIA